MRLPEKDAKRLLKIMLPNVREKDLVDCKFCGSVNVVRNGTFRSVQRWLCKSCGRAFVDNQALPKMKTSINQIADSISMYYRGMSLNDIRGHSGQEYKNHPSDSAIYNWVVRFSKIAVEETKRHTPKVGDTWIADETALFVGGNHRYWLLDVIDSDTRYLLASRLSPTRTSKDIALLMKEAHRKAGKAPKRILTDKWQAYLNGIELVFGAEAKHIQSSPFEGKDSTAIIERWHGTLKDRTKVMRGFKQAKTARLILDGWLVFYNYFRPHESLNDKPPAQVAGIKFPFKNWLDVVKSQAYPTKQTAVGVSSPKPSGRKPRYHTARRTRRIKYPEPEKLLYRGGG